MNILRNRVLKTNMTFAVLSAILVTIGCSTSPSLPKGAVGNLDGRYNYSPTVIDTGGVRQLWWCSAGVNPDDKSQDSDAIYFEAINMSTLARFGPALVLAETPGAWDSVFTCNPKVIGGVFANPLGDGENYRYAMYYVGLGADGTNNHIGVAFSNDGLVWKKYPQPIISSTSPAGYGVGQPAVYNADHKAAIRMFYEDSNPTEHHIAAVSTDGVHFTVQGTLTSYGLDSDDPQATWGDVSYDSRADEWYAAFNRPLRPASTTGGVVERGQYGVELYKIPQDALLTGIAPWQRLATMDTNATGFESNFIAGFVRDLYGNIDVGSYPAIQMYTSISYPPPNWQSTPAEAGTSAGVVNWILMPMQWSPAVSATIPLNRYFNGVVYEVTTGWIDPNAGFQLQAILGHLYANPSAGATVAFFGCKGGEENYFVSLDVSCEGQRILGRDGYGYSQPVSGLNLVALYRCSTGQYHFVSKDSKCEGQTTDELLGYVVP
jgi:hypothetical protein